MGDEDSLYLDTSKLEAVDGTQNVDTTYSIDISTNIREGLPSSSSPVTQSFHEISDNENIDDGKTVNKEIVQYRGALSDKEVSLENSDGADRPQPQDAPSGDVESADEDELTNIEAHDEVIDEGDNDIWSGFHSEF